MSHKLYVNPLAASSKTVIAFVHDNLQTLKDMGLSVKVFPVSEHQLATKELRAAFAKKGINVLPALVTDVAVYNGTTAILRIYRTNIEKFEAQGRAGGVIDTGDELSDYYRRALSDTSADADIAGEDVSTDAYGRKMQAAMARRGHARTPGTAGTNATKFQSAPPPATRPARPPADEPLSRAQEQDNIDIAATLRRQRTERKRAGAGAKQRPTPRPASDPEEDDIQSTVDKISQGLGADAEGGQDNDMMRSFWEGRMSTTSGVEESQVDTSR